MIVDAITEEIRAVRRSLAARQCNDLDRIYEDIRRGEQSSGRVFVSLPERPARPPAVAIPADTPVPAVLRGVRLRFVATGHASRIPGPKRKCGSLPCCVRTPSRDFA